MKRLFIGIQVGLLFATVTLAVSCQQPERDSQAPMGPPVTSQATHDQAMDMDVMARAAKLKVCLNKTSFIQVNVEQTYYAGGYYLSQCAQGESLELIHSIVELYLKIKNTPTQDQIVTQILVVEGE